MKKLSYISIAFAALTAFASCSKDMDAPEQNIAPAGAPTTFEVSSPETKTALDGLHVNWAAGDEIRVYGHNTDSGTYTDNAVYELTSGAGSGTGTFTLKAGETGLSGTYDEYYAVYPGNLTVTGLPSAMTLPRLNTDPNHLRGQNPSAGQCDPKLAVMTAKYDGSRLVFRHGVAYIKLTIPDDGVTKIDINFTNNCLADTPTYNSETGALSSVGNSAKNVTSVEGTFTKGATYYFAAIPRAGYAPSTTTITLTGGETYSTSHFTAALEVGKVYNLGMPQKNPAVTASDVNIESDATAGTIVFTVNNVKGGSVTSEVLTGATVANLSLGAVTFNTSTGEGSVSFTCDANTDTENAKTATVRLTYTYDTDKTATKDVTITQKKAGSALAEKYDWNFTDWDMASLSGVAKNTDITSSFNHDGLYVLPRSSGTKWNVSSSLNFVITGGNNADTYTESAMDERGGLFKFTTLSAGTVTVKFAANGSSERKVKVRSGDNDEVVDNVNSSSSTSDIKTATFSSIPAGTIRVYGDSSIRVYEIHFTN